MTTLDTFSATLLDGTVQPLDQYRGQVVLVVNVASNCGFTSQYQGLQALYEKFQARGFAVLGFPCNQFGGQEPGDANDIRQFCDTRYRITFPMFDKIDVNGANAHPLFQWLKSSRPGVLGSEAIKWNFTKFLVGRDGRVVARYAPTTAPSDLEKDINAALEG